MSGDSRDSRHSDRRTNDRPNAAAGDPDASAAALEAVARAERERRSGEHDPAENGVDQRDDVRRAGDVGEEEDGERDGEEHARQDERERESAAPLADALEQSLSEACLLHRSYVGCGARGVKDRVTASTETTPRTTAVPTLTPTTAPDETTPTPAHETAFPTERDTSMSTEETTEDDDRGTDPSLVEYCVNNVTAETRTKLATASAETRGLPCLERCGTCRREALLVVDGEVHTGDAHDPLLADLPGVTP